MLLTYFYWRDGILALQYFGTVVVVVIVVVGTMVFWHSSSLAPQ
jgi:hypothetical protein